MQDVYYVFKENVVRWWAWVDIIFFANGAFMPSHDLDCVEYYLKRYRKSKNIKKENKE